MNGEKILSSQLKIDLNAVVDKVADYDKDPVVIPPKNSSFEVLKHAANKIREYISKEIIEKDNV